MTYCLGGSRSIHLSYEGLTPNCFYNSTLWDDPIGIAKCVVRLRVRLGYRIDGAA